MLEQVTAQLEERYGPFDDTTRWLLNVGYRGYRTTEQGLFSGAHILLVAIRPGGVIPALFNIPELHDLLRILQRSNLDHALQAWIANSQNALPGGSQCTYGLLAALEAARVSAGQGADITWYQLLRALLEHDPDVTAVLAGLTVSSTTYQPSDSFPTGAHRALSPAANFTPIRQEPTGDLRYAIRHHVAMDRLAFQIEQRKADQVIVVRGMHGSPLERLPQVLADALAKGEYPQLAGLRHVYTENVGRLQAAAARDENEAIETLRACLDQARTFHAILILTRGELLANGEPANATLLGMLLNSGSVPVIISYEDATEKDAEIPITLRFISYRLVTMAPYSLQNTRNALPIYYANFLNERGVYLADDAFDTLYALEPAIYVESDGAHKRDVLPYLVADIMVETVKTALMRDNAGFIRAQALTAMQRTDAILHNLHEGRMLLTALVALDSALEQGIDDPALKSDADKVAETWRPRWELIKGIPDRMRLFAEEIEAAPPSDDPRAITQDMVTAQFLSDVDYQIHLWAAFNRCLDEYDPRLRDLIVGG